MLVSSMSPTSVDPWLFLLSPWCNAVNILSSFPSMLVGKTSKTYSVKPVSQLSPSSNHTSSNMSKLKKVVLFEPMSTSIKQADRKEPVLSPSSPPTMRETRSNNSMDMTGKEEHWKFEKIATQEVEVEDLVEEADTVEALVVEVAMVVAMEDVVDSVDEEDTVVDMEEEVVVTAAAHMVVVAGAEVEGEPTQAQLKSLSHPTHSRTLQHQAASAAQSSMCATFLGQQATKIWLSCSPPSERSNVPKFSTNQMVDPKEVVLSNSRVQSSPKPPFPSSLATCMVVALLV